MKIDDKIRDEELQHDINRESVKMSWYWHSNANLWFSKNIW